MKMRSVILLVSCILMSCGDNALPPIDQKDIKNPEELKFPPDFYARPAKGEKPKMELPKAS
jgi:hypothetical protein